MVRLHLELEGDVGEVVRALRRIGGGDNEGGEIRDGPRPAPAEERTAAVDTVPEPEATSATLLPGHWTQELAADFTAGLEVVAGRAWRSWPGGYCGTCGGPVQLASIGTHSARGRTCRRRSCARW